MTIERARLLFEELGVEDPTNKSQCHAAYLHWIDRKGRGEDVPDLPVSDAFAAVYAHRESDVR